MEHISHDTMAHLYTAVAYYVIGTIMAWSALQVGRHSALEWIVWADPYLTEKGKLVFTDALPFALFFIYMFGLFIFACGIDHSVKYVVDLSPAMRDIIAWIEAIISVATMTMVILATLYFRIRKMTRWN